jgi:prepilin-type processing-associated H-X9-DG protein
LSNLKQIGLAIAMYADADRYHRCPMDGGPSTLVGSLRLLSNKVSNAKILCCPSDRDRHPEADFNKLTAKNLSYSYVPNLIWNPDHADSIVALDRISETAVGSRWPQTGNHKGTGGNVLFGDGHVAWVNALPSALKDKDGKEVVLSP